MFVKDLWSEYLYAAERLCPYDQHEQSLYYASGTGVTVVLDLVLYISLVVPWHSGLSACNES